MLYDIFLAIFSALRVYAISGYRRSLTGTVFSLILLRAGVDWVRWTCGIVLSFGLALMLETVHRDQDDYLRFASYVLRV